MYGYPPPWGSGYPPPPQYPPQYAPQQPVMFIPYPMGPQPAGLKPGKVPGFFKQRKSMTLDQMKEAVAAAEAWNKEQADKNKAAEASIPKTTFGDKFAAFLLFVFLSPIFCIGYYLFLRWLFAKAGSF